MTITFDFPVSDSKIYEGMLHVSAEVEYPDVVIQKVIFSNAARTTKTDITAVVDNYCHDLKDKLEEAAQNNWENLQPDERYYDEEMEKENRFA